MICIMTAFEQRFVDVHTVEMLEKIINFTHSIDEKQALAVKVILAQSSWLMGFGVWLVW